MVKVNLDYNPYTMDFKAKFNGKEPHVNSLVEKYEHLPLQTWIKEIPHILYDEMNGYDFDLSCATHKKMLEASKLSFDKGDNTGLMKIFSNALTPYNEHNYSLEKLKILTIDDLTISAQSGYEYYGYGEYEYSEVYEEIYREKIYKMDAAKRDCQAKCVSKL